MSQLFLSLIFFVSLINFDVKGEKKNEHFFLSQKKMTWDEAEEVRNSWSNF
jgi:hypothetical protein